ncbi:MAG: thioredoxin domain-containing protein [Syntrophobacteraceae bacterium]
MAQDNFIVRCPQCRAKNRIPPARAAQKAVCGKCRTPLPRPLGFPEHPVAVFDHTFKSEVLGFAGPTAALFWAPWCGHCARLMPIFDELAGEYSGFIKFAKIDQDKNPGTASQYQVQSVPTLLLFKDGRLIERLAGALPKHQLEHHLKSIL